MTFRNENAATTAVATEAPKKRNRVRMAVMGGVIAALPVAGLVTATTASAASTSTWNAVAQCESTGNWSIDSGNGFYGGLQFTSSTWAAYGGTQYAPQANLATPAQQIAIAEKVLADQGPGAWPVCSVQAGLTAGGAPAQVDTTSASTGTSSTGSTSSTANTDSTPAPAAQPQTAPVQRQAAQVPQAAPQTQAKTQGDGGAKQDHRKAKQAAKQSSTGNYTVKSGDTLSAIAAAHGTSVQSLYAKNASVIGGNPDLIMPGQVLSI